jgi:hypothetical protein
MAYGFFLLFDRFLNRVRLRVQHEYHEVPKAGENFERWLFSIHLPAGAQIW